MEDPVGAGMLNDNEHKKMITDAIADRIGREVDVQIQQNESNHSFEDSYVDLEQLINMDITIEEE